MIELISRLVPGILLFAAGASKLIQLSWFISTVASYRLLPQLTVATTARLIAISEVTVGYLLLVGLMPRLAAAGAISLFLIFIGGMLVNLLRKRVDLDCGCIKRGHKVSWRAMSRNTAMIGLLLLQFQRSWSNVFIMTAFAFLLAVVVLTMVLDLGGSATAKHKAVTA